MRTPKTATQAWSTVARALIVGVAGVVALSAAPADAQRISLTDIDAKIDTVQSTVDGIKTVVEDTNAVVKEGPTPIIACGTVSQPGSYVLIDNLTSNPPGTCLTVAASHVTIDLAGFRIDCAGSGNGVFDNGSSLRSVAVRNGTITGCNTGIGLSFTLGVMVERIRAFENSTGIATGSGGTVTGNSVLLNTSDGIIASFFSTVSGNNALGNGNRGISASTGSTVADNTSNGNESHGINVSCPSNVLGNTATNNAATVPGAVNLNLNGAGCNSSNNLAP